MTGAVQALDDWHGLGNARCRSVCAKSTWLMGQLDGAFMQSLDGVLAPLLRVGLVQNAGFEDFQNMKLEELRIAMTNSNQEHNMFSTYQGTYRRSTPSTTPMGIRKRTLSFCMGCRRGG